MRICHYMWGNNIGGIWTLVRLISKQQSFSNEVGILFTNLNRDFSDEGIFIHEVRFSNNLDFRPDRIMKTIKILKNYDIIHLHTVFFPVFLASILSGRKIIFTFHGLTLPEKGAVLNLIDHTRFLIIKYLFRNRVKVITTVSSSMRLLLEKYFKSFKDIKVIYNCSRFDESDFVWDEDKPDKSLKILTYCRIVPSKRIELIPEIIEILRTRNLEIQYDIYGEGETKKKIESLLKLKDLPIRLHSFTTSIKEAIITADICLFPFKGETFGIAALEVLSIGRIPIVFEDGGGLVEIMRPIAAGKFIVKDISSCVDLIEEIYLNRSILVKYKKQIFERIREFRVENIVAQYQQLYESA